MKFSKLMLDRVAVILVLLYPIMVVGYVPFGGGIRYYSVLLPVAMMLMVISIWNKKIISWEAWLEFLLDFSRPFLPFLLALLLVSIVHNYFVFFADVSRGVLYAAFLYALLRFVAPNRRLLVLAPAIACFVYMFVAFYEVGVLGRGRAWGLVYENTFGRFTVFCAGLSLLAVFDYLSNLRWKIFLLLASLAGILAAVWSYGCFAFHGAAG